MAPGLFITFEGGDGSGKSTQISLLAQALRDQGLFVMQTREPGGTAGAEHVRNLLKKGDLDQWDGLSELLLLYAARRDHVIKVIEPALAKGITVLCDRFHDSSRAYQGVARGLGIEVVDQIHRLVLGDFKPDITFFIDIPPEEGLRRATQRADGTLDSLDRLEKMGDSFHYTTYDAYKQLQILEPHRIFTIDGKGSPDDVHQRIRSVMRQKDLMP